MHNRFISKIALTKNSSYFIFSVKYHSKTQNGFFAKLGTSSSLNKLLLFNSFFLIIIYIQIQLDIYTELKKFFDKMSN